MFLAWLGGACLCVVPGSAKLAPARFIRESRLTTWHSVPSVILLLDRLGQLKEGLFPDLRLSRFAGEALPVEAVEAWRRAAPQSRIENLYGPTECAVNVTRHRWTPGDPSRNGIVPIGHPLAGVESLLRDEAGTVIGGPGTGELLVAGDQVTGGYLDDPEESARRFVRLPDRGAVVHYRTGDLVERSEDGTLFYCGRIDEQVQVRGNRVELQEIDAALRAVTGAPVAVAVPWPYGALRVDSIIAFVPEDCRLSTREIRGALSVRLPSYMVPEKILRVGDFPLNPNGKLDRRALAARAAASDSGGLSSA
jgi:non-ribosomal peptide synthetase component F